MEVMTLDEAAQFLRISRSCLYQRKDIPRHRLPGSRGYRYLKCELLAWLKGEVMGQQESCGAGAGMKSILTLATTSKPVYHRSKIYR